MNYQEYIADIKQRGQFRFITVTVHDGIYVEIEGVRMLNMAGNDYLGVASDKALRHGFLESQLVASSELGSSASRLLTGDYPEYQRLEALLCDLYGTQAALLFNSGYHANVGILPALSDKRTLILADKLVHASVIDALKLCDAKWERFAHNDMAHLRRLVEKYHGVFDQIIIVTEAIFSMDGDLAKVAEIVEIKQEFEGVMVYVDEAHSFGVSGACGLGICEEIGCISDIDILVGTFGKGIGSMGAFVVCSELIREILVNRMRSLIFSTALPPITVAWSTFVIERLREFADRRTHLKRLSEMLATAIGSASESNIIPMVVGENNEALRVAERLREYGFYAPAVRPPTVPVGGARIRFSLSAVMTVEDIERLIIAIKEIRG
ncbi:MAG: 8-amino-7-oxononanoate synthase [Bacteroidales bacterium]